MRLTSKQIKEIIKEELRDALLEIYEPTEADIEAIPKNMRKSPIQRRVFGIQSPEEVKDDRAFMQQIQSRMQSGGQEMISRFMNGEVSCLHSIRYEGYATQMDIKKRMQKSENPFKTWLQQYGSSGKDMLSCAAFPEPPGVGPRENPEVMGMEDEWSNTTVFAGEWGSREFPGMVNSCGFYLKGYPVIVSKDDVMSQTLGVLPKGLTQHQAASGIAKRAGKESLDNMILNMKEFEEIGWAGEVLLDNWKIIGIYIQTDSGGIRLDDFWHVHVQNAIDTGLPVHIFNGEENIGHIYSPGDLDKVIRQVLPWKFKQ